MAAYNQVNGTTMTEHSLLTHPLKDEWGFDGVVVSDWYAARDTDETVHGGVDTKRADLRVHGVVERELRQRFTRRTNALDVRRLLRRILADEIQRAQLADCPPRTPRPWT